MTAYYAEPLVELQQGDAREVMAAMPADSVDCVVFSPPFFGLRKYDGVQELVWGAKDGCEHSWDHVIISSAKDSNRGDMEWTTGGNPAAKVLGEKVSQGQFCSLCGAWRGAWGLEPSVELWISHTVEVMQAVKRVLKPSGVCWVEVGDSYAGSGVAHSNDNTPPGLSKSWKRSGAPHSGKPSSGLKSKDLCLVPERLALALQSDGWWVRSRIVWAKPSPMPESVNDRPTKSHSTIWMLTKAAEYFWDGEAVRESYTGLGKPRRFAKSGNADRNDTGRLYEATNQGGRNVRDVWTFPTQPFGYELCQSCGQIYTAAQFGRLPERVGGHRCKCQGADGHTDWQEAIIEDSHDGLGAMQQPGWLCPDCETIYSLAEWNGLPQGRERFCRCGASDFLSHFATFPEALPTRCILASTSEAGCCPKCGKPWERQIQKSQGHGNALPTGKAVRQEPQDNARRLWERTRAARAAGEDHDTPFGSGETLGWAPTCKCDLSHAENVPATVLDVCSGSGTTVLAAKKLGRRAVGIDLSEKYLALARRRIEEVPMSLVKGG